MCGVIITVFSVTLTWPHVVAVLKVTAVDTGISLMGLYYLTLPPPLLLERLVELREWSCVVIIIIMLSQSSHQVYTAVILLSMMLMDLQEISSIWECISEMEIIVVNNNGA